MIYLLVSAYFEGRPATDPSENWWKRSLERKIENRSFASAPSEPALKTTTLFSAEQDVHQSRSLRRSLLNIVIAHLESIHELRDMLGNSDEVLWKMHIAIMFCVPSFIESPWITKRLVEPNVSSVVSSMQQTETSVSGRKETSGENIEGNEYDIFRINRLDTKLGKSQLLRVLQIGLQTAIDSHSQLASVGQAFIEENFYSRIVFVSIVAWKWNASCPPGYEVVIRLGEEWNRRHSLGLVSLLEKMAKDARAKENYHIAKAVLSVSESLKDVPSIVDLSFLDCNRAYLVVQRDISKVHRMWSGLQMLVRESEILSEMDASASSESDVMQNASADLAGLVERVLRIRSTQMDMSRKSTMSPAEKNLQEGPKDWQGAQQGNRFLEAEEASDKGSLVSLHDGAWSSEDELVYSASEDEVVDHSKQLHVTHVLPSRSPETTHWVWIEHSETGRTSRRRRGGGFWHRSWKDFKGRYGVTYEERMCFNYKAQTLEVSKRIRKDEWPPWRTLTQQGDLEYYLGTLSAQEIKLRLGFVPRQYYYSESTHVWVVREQANGDTLFLDPDSILFVQTSLNGARFADSQRTPEKTIAQLQAWILARQDLSAHSDLSADLAAEFPWLWIRVAKGKDKQYLTHDHRRLYCMQRVKKSLLQARHVDLAEAVKIPVRIVRDEPGDWKRTRRDGGKSVWVEAPLAWHDPRDDNSIIPPKMRRLFFLWHPLRTSTTAVANKSEQIIFIPRLDISIPKNLDVRLPDPPRSRGWDSTEGSRRRASSFYARLLVKLNKSLESFEGFAVNGDPIESMLQESELMVE